jgi:hypothetical protein
MATSRLTVTHLLPFRIPKRSNVMKMGTTPPSLGATEGTSISLLIYYHHHLRYLYQSHSSRIDSLGATEDIVLTVFYMLCMTTVSGTSGKNFLRYFGDNLVRDFKLG